MRRNSSPDGPSEPGEKISLRRQFSWTLPANVIYGLGNFALLMLLNKWAISHELGIAAAGRFNWAMAVTAPFFMFANLRFRTIVATDTTSRFAVRDFFQLRACLMGGVIIVAGGICGSLIANGHSAKAILVALLAASKVVESISDLCCGLQQRIERMDRIATSMIAHGLGMICAFSIAYLLTTNLLLAAAGLFLARLAVLCTYDIPVARLAAAAIPAPDQKQLPVNVGWRKRIRELLILAAPLGVTAALVSLTSNIPKYIIPEIFDDGMLGIYASLAMTIQAGNLIFRAVEMPVMPRLATCIANRDARAFWRLMLAVAGFFVVLAVVGSVISLFVGGPILSAIFNPAYASLGGLLAMVIICAAIAQVTGIVELAMIPARLTTVQIPLHCITVGLCFGLSMILIPRFEVTGALLAVTVCRIPFLIVAVMLLSRRLQESSTSPVVPSVSDSPTDGIRDAA